jgi:hypothetical protein
MKKYLLIELFKKIRENNIDLTNYEIDKIKVLTDKEIEAVLNSKYFDIAFKMIMDNVFMGLNNDVRCQIINLLNQSKEAAIAECVSHIARSLDVVASGLALELTRIVSKSVGQAQAEYATKITGIPSLLSTDLVLGFVSIISQSVSPFQAKYAWQLCLDKDVLESGLAPELTKIVSQSVGSAQAKFAFDVATNLLVLESGLAPELTKIVSQSVGSAQAGCAYEVATDPFVLHNGLALELTKLVSKSINERQALLACEHIKFSNLNDGVYLVNRVYILTNDLDVSQDGDSINLWNEIKRNTDYAAEIIANVYEDKPDNFDITADSQVRARVKNDKKD